VDNIDQSYTFTTFSHFGKGELHKPSAAKYSYPGRLHQVDSLNYKIPAMGKMTVPSALLVKMMEDQALLVIVITHPVKYPAV
jgi:hypothetical protein